MTITDAIITFETGVKRAWSERSRAHPRAPITALASFCVRAAGLSKRGRRSCLPLGRALDNHVARHSRANEAVHSGRGDAPIGAAI